jgi:two-component system CheB/CheR fusion protein
VPGKTKRRKKPAAAAGVEQPSEAPPPRDVLPFPIVGIGASAGGLEAFREMLGALPTDTGMAYVVVQHLAPTHESMLPDILARATAMPVCQVRDGMAVEPDTVYVIPPGTDMELSDGHLRLSPRTAGRGQHRPINLFLQSLAAAQGYRAIGVILSGTATDGTLGLEEIKGEGGITFAQDDTARQSSMPHSAVASGAVDFVLPPTAIAHELARIAKHPYVAPAGRPEVRAHDDLLEQVIEVVRAATGEDFRGYKRSTLYRRITRRVVTHKLEDAAAYLVLLHGQPAEVAALYDDFLISVTSFFRNPEAFEALKEKVFPSLIKDRSRQQAVRVWVMGCSTGEEAYSIAIAYQEFAAAARVQIPLQLFATDLNRRVVELARAGVYPKAVAQSLSPERLHRWFVDSGDGYRVAKEIRELCVFAQHNVLTAPPFSHLDLVSCRNLLIYLDATAQQRLVPILHYALQPHGYLLVGASETVGPYRELFQVADQKHKIYERKPGPGHLVPGLALRALPSPSPHAAAQAPPTKPGAVAGDPHREAERVLLTRFAPPSVLVNGDLEILQFRGETGLYLTPQPGKASLNLIKMLREGLVLGVRNTINRARKQEAPARAEGLRARSNGGHREVNVEVIPIGRPGPDGHFLVLFEEAGTASELRQRVARAEARAEQSHAPATAKGTRDEVAQLKHEIAATREYLQSLIEQQEAANEELQAANEEVQSANEELQSINEELETSKEQIQSSNEELATVNDELLHSNRDLSQSNNDFINLLSSVPVSIVMLGTDLRIRRFTPLAEKSLNLLATDVGRPITDIRLPIEIPDPAAVLAGVINEAHEWSRELLDSRGRWQSVRILSYKTAENRIEGAVLSVVDVHELRASLLIHQRLTEMLAQAQEPIMVWRWDGTVTYWNHACEETYGYAAARAVGRTVTKLLAPEPHAEVRHALRRDGRWRGELTHTTNDGTRIDLDSSMALVRDPDGQEHVIEAGRPITEYKRLAAELLTQAEQLRDADRQRTDFLLALAHELRNPLDALRNAVQLLNAPSNPEAPARLSHLMGRQVRTLARMIDDLLDVVRAARGEVALELVPLDLAAVLRHATERGRDQLEARSQRLSVSLGTEPVWVNGDAIRLTEVFGNLLSNASRFTNVGGYIWITLEVEPGGLGARGRAGDPPHTSAPTARTTGPHAVVRMRDDGVGIVPAVLPRVFDLFVQAQKAPDAEPGGLGLGLTLARRMVELHDGRVEASSAGQGQGSEFVVRLPIIPPPQG